MRVMRKALFSSIFALCAGPALAAADPAQCDATAFTLKKPAPTPPKVNKPQAVAKPLTAQAQPKKPKTTNRLISDCNDGKKKKPG